MRTERREKLDKALVIRSVLGDMGAFTDLVRKYQNLALAYVYHRLHDVHLSEDVVQESFLHAYEHLEQLRKPEAFSSWFRTILRKFIDRQLRKEDFSQIEFIEENYPSVCDRPESVAIDREHRRYAESLLEALPPKQRLTAILHYMDGLKSCEIAQFLEINEGTVRKRLHDARRSLKSFFQKETDMTVEQTLKSIFAAHVNDTMLRKIITEGLSIKLSGEKRELTTFFIDINEFTKLSENLHPEQEITLLNEFSILVHDTVLEQDGILDKMIGDAVMAYWGAPLHMKDQADRACNAALKIQERLAAMGPVWKSRGLPEITASIGIETGMVTIGNFGPPERPAYTPMGNSVNIAANLERFTRKHSINIAVGEATVKSCLGNYNFQRVDCFTPRNWTREMTVYSLSV
jgi:RNA polymerase sigma factor (sigma-70 family)